eukprot:1099244-Prorocentrum_minimum.AAC.1
MQPRLVINFLNPPWKSPFSADLGFDAAGRLWATATAGGGAQPQEPEGGAEPTPGVASLAVASLAADGTLGPEQEAPPAALAEALQVAPARRARASHFDERARATPSASFDSSNARERTRYRAASDGFWRHAV